MQSTFGKFSGRKWEGKHHPASWWGGKRTGWRSETGVSVLTLTLCRFGQLSSPVWASLSLQQSCLYAFDSYHLSKSLIRAVSTQVQEILDGQDPHSKTKERQLCKASPSRKQFQEIFRQLGCGPGCSLRALFCEWQFGLVASFKVTES